MNAGPSFDHIIERERGLRRSLSARRMSMIAIGGAIGTGLFRVGPACPFGARGFRTRSGETTRGRARGRSGTHSTGSSGSTRGRLTRVEVGYSGAALVLCGLLWLIASF